MAFATIEIERYADSRRQISRIDEAANLTQAPICGQYLSSISISDAPEYRHHYRGRIFPCNFKWALIKWRNHVCWARSSGVCSTRMSSITDKLSAIISPLAMLLISSPRIFARCAAYGRRLMIPTVDDARRGGDRREY